MSISSDRKDLIKKAIDASADKSGVVTPDGVVGAARDPKNPLHEEFNWDDAVAAHQHRLAVARHLIREVRYVSIDTTERVVKTIRYVHDPRTRKQAYIPLHTAAKNRQLARDIVIGELNRCLSAISRARDVSKALEFDLELDQLTETIRELQSRLMPATRGRSKKAGAGAELRT